MSQTVADSNTDLFVDLPFVQTFYLFPSKVSITIQAPERSERVTIWKGVAEIILQTKQLK